MEEVYRVVKIIDLQNIVIDAGSENYIKKGDNFEIYTLGNNIKDLDGNCLGTLDTIKETVTVVALFPKMCICQKLAISPAVALANIALSRRTAQDLNVDEKDFSGGLSEDLTIHIGDFARLTK